MPHFTDSDSEDDGHSFHSYSDDPPDFRANVPTKSGLVAHAVIASSLVALFMGSTLYFWITGKRIYDEDGNDSTTGFSVVLGLCATLVVVALFFSVLRYRNTRGTTSLLQDPDTATMFSSAAWVEASAPGQKPNAFPMVLLSIAAVGFFGLFLYTAFDILANASKGQPPSDEPPENGSSQGRLILLPVYLIFVAFFSIAARKKTAQYFYQRRFSQEPMISGVYSNGH